MVERRKCFATRSPSDCSGFRGADVFLDRTSEQQALADACRQLLVKEWPIESGVSATAATPLPITPWGSATNMGWLHVMSPEPAGGLGLSAVEAGAVSEEA